jgi:hypothetical protein
MVEVLERLIAGANRQQEIGPGFEESNSKWLFWA